MANILFSFTRPATVGRNTVQRPHEAGGRKNINIQAACGNAGGFLNVRKDGETMSVGRPRKFKTPRALENAWEEYKKWCDNQSVLTYEFCQKTGKFSGGEQKRRTTYTIEGFCSHIGLARSTFYQIYEKDNEFSDMVTRMREECEVDARMKFELGEIDPRLAALWMGRHGYSAKTNTDVTGAIPVVITGSDKLED